MPNLILRGVHIRFIDIRAAEAGLFCRAHLTADYSDTIIREMGWQDLPASFDSAKLDGELVAHSAILTPNGKDEQKHELEFEADKVSDFSVHRVKDGDDSTHTELRFIVRSVKEETASKLEDYWRKIGDGVAQMKLTYEKQGSLLDEGGAAA